MSNLNVLKNQYDAENIYGIPTVKKCAIRNKGLKFISFSQARNTKRNSEDKSIHFFIDDSKFNVVYNRPKRYVMYLAVYDNLKVSRILIENSPRGNI